MLGSLSAKSRQLPFDVRFIRTSVMADSEMALSKTTAIVTETKYCQRLRCLLQELGLLDRNLCIASLSDGRVGLPVVSVPPMSALHGLPLSLDIIEFKRSKKSRVVTPRALLIQRLKALLKEEWESALETDVPNHWEIHGDLVLLPDMSFTQSVWRKLERSLWTTVAQSLAVQRVARKKTVTNDAFRSPQVELLLGEDGFVEQTENGIRISYDVTKCMYSTGNISEKLRIARMNCRGQTVVDMFAGIGYFTLPYLVHAGADVVHACEWNPEAIKALTRNLCLNAVENRCEIHQGDCSKVCPVGVADHVNLGLLPSSECGWKAACRALRGDVGGVLHIHGNVDGDRNCWDQWATQVRDAIAGLLNESPNLKWDVNIEHIEHVKSYAARVSHLVVDLHCKPICETS